MKQEYHREMMALEWLSVLRLLLLVIPTSLTSAGAWWAVSADAPVFVTVSLGVAAGACWYLVVRQVFASGAAFRALELEIEHWSDDLDCDRLLRLGVPNQFDDRTQIVQPERVIPVSRGGVTVRTMSGFDVNDLAFFVDESFRFGKFGTSQRNWLGQQLPSGRVLDTVEEWRAMLDVFGRVGLLTNVGVERECSRWLIHSAAQIKSAMGLPVGSNLPVERILESA